MPGVEDLDVRSVLHINTLQRADLQPFFLKLLHRLRRITSRKRLLVQRCQNVSFGIQFFDVIAGEFTGTFLALQMLRFLKFTLELGGGVGRCDSDLPISVPIIYAYANMNWPWRQRIKISGQLIPSIFPTIFNSFHNLLKILYLFCFRNIAMYFICWSLLVNLLGLDVQILAFQLPIKTTYLPIQHTGLHSV